MRHFAWIVVIASVVRGAALFVNQSQLTADPDAYREIARGLTVCKTFGIVSFDPTTRLATASPTAFRPPLYPWLLSWFTNADGTLSNEAVACLHLFLGVFTVAMTYLVARRMLVRQAAKNASVTGELAANSASSPESPVQTSRPEWWPAIFAAGLVMVDPLLIQSSTLVMTETLATALVIVVLWFWLNLTETWQPAEASREASSKRWLVSSLLLGIALSLAFLCRPTFIVWPVLLGAYSLVIAIVRRSRLPVISLAVTLSVVALAVGGWTLRNFNQLGRPIWATTHGGYTLLLGNNPPFYEHLRTTGASNVPFWRRNWDPQFFFDRWAQRDEADPRTPEFWNATQSQTPLRGVVPISNELTEDRLAYETAKATIQRDSSGFLLACRWRLERLFSPLPLQTSDRPSKMLWMVGAFYTFTFILIAIGLWRIGRRLLEPTWAPAIALWVALATVHTFYWTDMRMRAPAVPVLSILAAASVATRRFGASKIA
jgi:hypothetical protein